MKIGILAVQGDFSRTQNMLSGLGVETVEVRLPGSWRAVPGLSFQGRIHHHWKNWL